MGIFDLFKKKKEPEYDVTNLTVEDLAMGFIFEYDLDTWQVKEEYEYDWGSHNFTKELLVDNGIERAYLEIEDKGDVSINFTKKIKIRDLAGDIIDRIVQEKTPPKELIYEGVRYYLHTDSAGYFRDKSKKTEDWEEFMSWQYFDDNEELIIGITQWDEREFDAVAGKVLKPFQISNIMPAG